MTGHLNTPPGMPTLSAAPSAPLSDAFVRPQRSFNRRENSISEFAADGLALEGHLLVWGRGHRTSRAGEDRSAAPTRNILTRQEVR